MDLKGKLSALRSPRTAKGAPGVLQGARAVLQPISCPRGGEGSVGSCSEQFGRWRMSRSGGKESCVVQNERGRDDENQPCEDAVSGERKTFVRAPRSVCSPQSAVLRPTGGLDTKKSSGKRSIDICVQ